MDTTQLLKGVLDVAVLAAIQDEDGYGYDVVRRLRAAGLDEVGDASVYGTLRRLYSAGALTSYVVPSDDGPHRKYYGINAEGRAMLHEQRASWTAFAETMSALLAPTHAAVRPAAVRAASTRAASTRTASTRPASVRTIGEN
jgi:PadR family transcriptional regulator PadR